ATGAARVVLDNDPVRLGRAWHAVLEQAGALEHLQRVDRASVARRFDLEGAQVADVFDAARLVLGASHLARFFSGRGDAELDLVDENGDLLRIDRIVDDGETCWVIDFKWRVIVAERRTYERQVERYCSVVRQIHPKRRVRGVVIAADGEMIEIG